MIHQKTLDGFDFEVVSTIKVLPRPSQDERIQWDKLIINPKSKQGESLTSYFARYLAAGFKAEDIRESLVWDMQKRGLKWSYEHERRFEIAMTARTGENKTHVKPMKKEIIKFLR